MAGRPRKHFHYKTPMAQRLSVAVGSETISDICLKTGAKRDSVSRYLSGETDPPASFVADIAREYHRDAEWLLIGEDAHVDKAVIKPIGEKPVADGHLEALISANESFCALVGMLHRLHAVFLQYPETVSLWRDMIKERKEPYEKMLEGLDRGIAAIRAHEKPQVAEALTALFGQRNRGA